MIQQGNTKIQEKQPQIIQESRILPNRIFVEKDAITATTGTTTIQKAHKTTRTIIPIIIRILNLQINKPTTTTTTNRIFRTLPILTATKKDIMLTNAQRNRYNQQHKQLNQGTLRLTIRNPS